MESKYDKVVLPDNTYLANSEHDDFGTGVYSVSYKDFKRENTFKLACFRIHKRKQRTVYFVCGMIVVIVIIIGIVIALTKRTNSIASPASSTGYIKDKTIGLDFFPKPKDGHVIEFTSSSSSFLGYTRMLDSRVHVYNLIEQSDNSFSDCDTNTRPIGKQCRLTTGDFGECDHMMLYGYKELRPCILLTLKPPNDTVPQPFSEDSEVVKEHFQSRWSPHHVGISCQGETAEDDRYLGKPHNTIVPIVYGPANGFSRSFFPVTSSSKYRYPSVMVQFNTIATHHLVSIKCTAWASNFNNGKPQDSPVYTAAFKILIH